MVIYFTDRRMNTLGLATTELQGGFTISEDLKSEDTDTGVASFECYIHWTEETRALANACTAAGNYLLRSNNSENEFYTIVESEEDTKDQTIYIYAEDAGMDLLNETVGAFAADEAHPIAWYVEKYAADTGFEIGLNEISDLSRKLEWTGEATAAERIASVATQFDNAEISYSFDIKGLTITHKYINIHKKRGKDAGVQLRLNREVDRIITTTSIADLATALYVTGGTPEGEEDPITLAGYVAEESDGDIYTDGTGFVKSRSALATWSRYVWSGEPNTDSDHVGHIVKQWSYDTTSQSELYNRSVTQLKKVYEPAVNYQIDIQQLPENVGIGDTIDVIDEKGELFLQSRILQLQTSVCNKKQTATLGEFLIKDSGISQTVRELAEQFEILAKSRAYYTWTAYADDAKGNGISLDPTGKGYMGTATNRSTPTVDISDPSIFTWVKVTGTGIEEINVYYGVSDSPMTVPTEWTTTPPEVLRNEYTWSYTEYIYTSGMVEATTPHIIAYYDYLEVDELDAKVAHIQYIIAGEESVDELIAIHLTGNNVVIDNAVIEDAMIASVSADKITAGTIYTNWVTIADDEGHHLWIDGATIQLKDDNNVVRIQMGMDAQGNYDYYLMDENQNIIWDARGLTEDGLIGNGAIIRDEAVHPEAAIQGSKLDIVSVVDCINENGDTVINAGHVEIDGQSLETWYTSLTNNSDGTLTVIQSELKQVSDELSMVVYKDDISDILDEQVWAQLSVRVGEISLNVGTQKVTIDELGNYIDQTYATNASLTVLEDSITSKVTKFEEDVNGSINGMETKIEQLPDSITASVMEQVGKEYATKASLVLEIDENGHGVMSGSADYIYLTGKQIYIEADNFSLTQDQYITIDQNNFTLTKEGAITANSGTIGGWTITQDELYSEGTNSDKEATSISMKAGQIDVNNDWGATMTLSASRIDFYLDGAEYGTLGLVASNVGNVHTYTSTLYSYKDGVTLGFYTTKSGVTQVYPGLSILQGNLYDYFGDGKYRIYLHEATYVEDLTANTLTVNNLHYDDSPTAITISGTTYGYKRGKFVWIRLYGVSGSSLASAAPSFPTPANSCSFPMSFLNNSNLYIGYVYYNGSEWGDRVAPTYGGSQYSGSSYSGGSYYGIICYYTS